MCVKSSTNRPGHVYTELMWEQTSFQEKDKVAGLLTCLDYSKLPRIMGTFQCTGVVFIMCTVMKLSSAV